MLEREGILHGEREVLRLLPGRPGSRRHHDPRRRRTRLPLDRAWMLRGRNQAQLQVSPGNEEGLCDALLIIRMGLGDTTTVLITTLLMKTLLIIRETAGVAEKSCKVAKSVLSFILGSPLGPPSMPPKG